MKHIKRKFLKEFKLPDDGYEFVADQITKAPKNIKINLKDSTAYAITTEKSMIQCFIYNLEGKNYLIPEPDPILIYFSNAQGFLTSIESYRDKLFIELKKPVYEIGDVLNIMFAFYGVVTSFASSLSNSIEAFVNSKIPKNFTIDNPDRRGKKMDKYQIIRYLSLENKLKYALNVITEKNFLGSHHYEQIKRLATLRNDITHAKADINHDVNYYEKLYCDALNFDYSIALQAGKEMINFYNPSLIEPCDCGGEH